MTKSLHPSGSRRYTVPLDVLIDLAGFGLVNLSKA